MSQPIPLKPKIAIVTGGFSGESVIAHQSAKLVMEHVDRDQFHVFLIDISIEKWVAIHNGEEYPIDKNDFSFNPGDGKINFDSAFIVIHGTPGEDGKLQGYFDLIGMPYHSSDLLSSALTFNKGLCNTLLRQYGVLSANSVVLKKGDVINTEYILSKVSLPCFVKPNNGGSSLGISKVSEKSQLEGAIRKAMQVDDEIIIEDFIAGTEITCSVARLKGKVKSLAVTEIVTENEFFDFDAKYHDAATQEITPARIPEHSYEECMFLSEFIYDKLNCSGMIRVDYILQDDQLFLIEVNTIPGLSAASLLPKQAVYAQVPLKDLFTSVMYKANT